MLKRIKNKEEISKTFYSGNTINSSDKKVKAVYCSSYQEIPPVIKYAIAISSKSGNSVWRNRFKRLIREAINTDKAKMEKLITETESNIKIIFLPLAISQKSNRKIFLKEIQPSVSEIFLKLRNELTRERSKKSNIQKHNKGFELKTNG